jgi:hypothetical protein
MPARAQARVRVRLEQGPDQLTRHAAANRQLLLVGRQQGHPALV